MRDVQEVVSGKSGEERRSEGTKEKWRDNKRIKGMWLRAPSQV